MSDASGKLTDASKASRSTTGDLLKVIETLSGQDKTGVTPLARALGVPVPTAYRMLRVLERSGFVEQLHPSKEYRMTLKLFELGCQIASRTTIRDVAAVEIERLAEQTGMTSNLGVLAGCDVLYLSKVDTDVLLTLNLPPGSRAPATCTAMGKAMLAFDHRPPARVVGDGPYPGRTPHSIVTLAALVEELGEVRARGFALDRQELALGLWCVAAPIVDGRGVQVGAISVAAYRHAMKAAECDRLGALVLDAARRVSAQVRNLAGVGELGDLR